MTLEESKDQTIRIAAENLADAMHAKQCEDEALVSANSELEKCGYRIVRCE